MIVRRRPRNNLQDLFQAISDGHIAELSFYLKSGGNPDLEGPYGSTFLLEAVKEQNQGKVGVLLNSKCDVNKTDSLGCAPIHVAVELGSIVILKMLLLAGADVNQFHKQTTPLILAAGNNNFEAAELLIKYGCGCNVNLENYFKETALAHAIVSGSSSVCKLLLQNGASIQKCYHSNFKTKINKHLCYNYALMETFLTFSRDADLHYHLLMSCIYHKKDVARLILRYFSDPFQLKGLGFIMKQEEEDFWLELAQSVIKPYSLATKCSPENKLLQMLLNFCETVEIEIQRNNHRSRAMMVMKVLIEHGLVIHPRTSLKKCGDDCDCRQCIIEAQFNLSPTSSLKGQCCSRIRQCLGSHISPDLVNLLQLPKQLKRFVLIDDW